MHQEGYKVDTDFLVRKMSEEIKRIVFVKKKKDSANHKNKLLFLRSEKKLRDPHEKGGKHLSLHQPRGNSLAVTGRSCSRARGPFGNAVPH